MIFLGIFYFPLRFFGKMIFSILFRKIFLFSETSICRDSAQRLVKISIVTLITIMVHEYNAMFSPHSCGPAERVKIFNSLSSNHGLSMGKDGDKGVIRR